MKNRFRFFTACAAAVCLLAALALAGCDMGEEEGEGGTFTSVDAFRSWLAKKRPAATDAPYAVTLKVRSINGLKGTLISNGSKYVSIDFTGSTFTDIEMYGLSTCGSLIGVIIPDSVTSIGYSAFDYCRSLSASLVIYKKYGSF